MKNSYQALALALALSSSPAGAGPLDLAALGIEIDAAVAGSKDIPSVVVSVSAPRQHIAWTHATGVRAEGGAAAQAADEFRIASVTKSFVAAAILRLVEDSRLRTDQPIAGLLPKEIVATLIRGGYDPSKITLRHLLSHRSGIRNYADVPSYADAVGEGPTRQWSAAEQISRAVDEGPPFDIPGVVAEYSDTNYVILGQIVERLTRKPLGRAVEQLVGFQKLGLRHTYWEEAVSGKLATLPATRLHAYQDGVDTGPLNPSFDLFGGGGLVSTADDLVRFYQALLSGRVFHKTTTLKLMQTVSASKGSLAALDYGLGIYRLAETAPVECWGHPGHWGTLAAWCPKANIGFAVSVNGAGASVEAPQQIVFDMIGKAVIKIAN